MIELISGKEALIALANGKAVEYKTDHGGFAPIEELFISDIIGDSYYFRIKPRTITLNGIEVPCVKMIVHSGGNSVKIVCHSIEDAAAIHEALRSIFNAN